MASRNPAPGRASEDLLVKVARGNERHLFGFRTLPEFGVELFACEGGEDFGQRRAEEEGDGDAWGRWREDAVGGGGVERG